jgi:hypothetical protein
MLLLRDHARRLGLVLYLLGGALFVCCAVASYRRHLHVDELTSLYSVQVGSAFGHGDFALPVELNSVWFRPLARALGSSARLFVGFRCFQLSLLCALCWALSRVQQALPSPAGRASVFIAAVSFGPLWRHGFEVRHDIFVAFSIVLLVWAGERARAGRTGWLVNSAASCGALLVQANSFKAFTIWLPALGLCAVLAARQQGFTLRRLCAELLRFVPGVVLGLLLVFGTFACAGMLREYLDQVRQYAAFSALPPYRLAAKPLLDFAIERAPLHALFVLVGLTSIPVRLIARKSLGSALVPFAAFVLSLATLIPNPTPFPYNLTWLSPAWLLMASVGMAETWRLLVAAGRARVAAGLALLAGVLSVLAFLSCEQDPYYRRDWDRQLAVVSAAEALTAPDEPVLDLTGIVLTRPPPSKYWLVHSLFMKAYHEGRRETVRHIIERAWPPVVIEDYRWGFLDRSDIDALQRNYIRYSADLWTLGARLRRPDTSLQIRRAGRYRASAAGGANAQLDGSALHDGDIRWLSRGAHAVTSDVSYRLAWVGPGSPPNPPPAASPLFENGELRGQRDSK